MTESEPPDEGRHDVGASPEDEAVANPAVDNDHHEASDDAGDRTETDATESDGGKQTVSDTDDTTDNDKAGSGADTDTDTDTEAEADGGDERHAVPAGGLAEDGDDGRGGTTRLAAVGSQLRRKRWWVPISVVVVVALVAGAFLVGRGSSGGKQTKASTVPAGFATYRSPDGSFSISYPGQWQVVTDPGVSLLLSAGGNDALSIRELTLQQPVDTKNVASIKAVTDAVLSTPSAQLQVLLSRPITIGGINGYYYLYTFPSGNTRGVHAHYFLFQGRKLTELVFQALPITDFQRLAPLFDQVSGSFRSNPKVLPPPPTAPATTAPGSTAPGTTAPATTAPPAGGPATTAPGSTAPPATAPGSTAPPTTAPGSTAPGGTP